VPRKVPLVLLGVVMHTQYTGGLETAKMPSKFATSVLMPSSSREFDELGVCTEVGMC
jgi:hypothetical protein